MFLIGCGNSGNKTTPVPDSDTTSAPGESFALKSGAPSNSLLIKENCVIFLFPDSTEIKTMQAKYSEEDYNEIVSDMTWYPSVASEVLDSLGIKNQYCDNEIIILRNSKNNEIKFTRKDLKGDMILFNVNKEPIVSSSIDFDKKTTLEYFDM
jgi:hypothetical protein